MPSITPAYSFTLDAAGNRTNFVQISSNANLRIDPDFKSPYSDQYIVQFEQELMKDLGLQVNYVHKRGEDYGGWQDIAGQYVQVPYVDSVGTDATGETVMVYRLISDPASRVFLQTNPDGHVHALRRRHDDGDQAHVATTGRACSRWCCRNRKAGSARARASRRPARRAARPASFGRDAAGPNDFVNTDGRLIGDRPVVAKAQLIYRFPWGILGVGQPAAPDRPPLFARSPGQRPRLPGRAADQHGTEHRRPPRRRTST